MTDFMKQDIFFFVTTVAVVILTILIGILVAYVIRIIRKIDYITDKAKQQTDLISEDLGELRQNIKEGGFKIKHLGNFLWNLGKRK